MVEPAQTNPFKPGSRMWVIWIEHHLNESAAVSATLGAVLRRNVDPSELDETEKAALAQYADDFERSATMVGEAFKRFTS
jgi:hypothetical protein